MRLRYSCLIFLLASAFIYLVLPLQAEDANPALSFDGAGDYVSLPQINVGSVFSVETWFYFNSPAVDMTLLKNNYAGANFGSVFLNMNDLEWWFGQNLALEGGSMAAQSWYHLAFVSDGTTVKLYVNGTEKASGNFSPNYNNTLEIGQSEGNYWNGKIDEVRLYSRALSAAEVAEHYGWTFNSANGLIGYWNFNEGSGAVAGDSSGNGYDGTINGATWAEGPVIPVSTPAPVPVSTPAPASKFITKEIANDPPSIAFTGLPKEKVWHGKKDISYLAADANPLPGGLRNKPIDIYYSDNNGISWKDFLRDEANAGVYAFDSSQLPDGDNYKIKMTATDGYGLVAEAISNSFAVDNTGPNFKVVISPPPPIKEKDNLVLTIISSEELKQVPEVQIIQKGAEPQTLVVKGAWKDFSAAYTVLKGYLGEAVILIKGSDLAGSSGETIISGKTFSVGRLGPPAPTIDDPVDGQIFSGPNIRVSGRAEAAAEIALVLNGQQEFKTKPRDKGLFVFENIVLSDLNNGLNTLNVLGIDQAGVRSDEASVSLKLNKPPKISLIPPISGTLSGKKEIKWLASDPNNDKLSYSMEYSIDGKNWDILAAGLIEDFYELDTASLFDGPGHRLKVIASDAVETAEVISEEFTVANNFYFSISNIPPNYLLNTTLPVFNGLIKLPRNKLVSLKYSLDKEKWDNAVASDGQFYSAEEEFKIKIASPLIDGKYNLFIQAKDDQGNLIKTFKTFIVDTVPPIPPVITSPAAAEVIDGGKDVNPELGGIQIGVSGKSEAGASLDLTVNGRHYKIISTNKGEFFFKDVTFFNNGVNRFFLSSFDAIGNETKLDGYIISNTPPVISGLAPQAGDFIGRSAEIKWKVSDKDNNQITSQIFYRKKNKDWLIIAQDLTVNSFKWDTSALAEGEYGLKIAANDGFSETFVIIDKFFIDSVAPQISLETEVKPLANNIRTVFSGNARDNLSGIRYVEYSFDNTNWYKALITEGYESSKAKFEFYWRNPLADGSYKVRARASDGVGNLAYAEPINFSIDTSPPRIGSLLISSGNLILFPGAGGFINLFKDKSYKILLSASPDAREISLNVKNTVLKLNFNKAVSLWEGEFNLKEAGDYPLEINAKDEAGNFQSKEAVKLRIINSGYAYNKLNNERIQSAKITLYIFNEKINSWPVWDGKAFGQENPQETDETGQYGFLVSAGRYRLEIQKSGFGNARSKELEIKNNTLINIDIPLILKKGVIEKIMGYFK